MATDYISPVPQVKLFRGQAVADVLLDEVTGRPIPKPNPGAEMVFGEFNHTATYTDNTETTIDLGLGSFLNTDLEWAANGGVGSSDQAKYTAILRGIHIQVPDDTYAQASQALRRAFREGAYLQYKGLDNVTHKVMLRDAIDGGRTIIASGDATDDTRTEQPAQKLRFKKPIMVDLASASNAKVVLPAVNFGANLALWISQYGMWVKTSTLDSKVLDRWKKFHGGMNPCQG